MSGTVKTVLIVGGVGVGAYLLVRMLAPPPAVRPGSNFNQAQSAVFAAGLIPGLGALSSLFSPSQPASNTQLSTSDQLLIANQNTTNIVGNQLIDPSTGAALVYGP